MRRVLTPILLWCLLCGADRVPVATDPAPPRLGIPWSVTLGPGLAGAELAGLPPLDGFVPLAPPRKEGEYIRLELLPLRPGTRTLPAFSFHRGPTGYLRSAPLSVEVSDELPASLQPAPLKEWPDGDNNAENSLRPSLLAATLLLVAFLLFNALKRSWRPGPRRPSLDELVGDELLAELQRRVDFLPAGKDSRWHAFTRELERARFAPAMPADLPARLLADYRRIEEGA